MAVVLKHPHREPFGGHRPSTAGDAQHAVLIFIGIFSIIGMAFLYGVLSLRQASRTSGDVPDELLSLSRRADMTDRGY